MHLPAHGWQILFAELDKVHAGSRRFRDFVQQAPAPLPFRPGKLPALGQHDPLVEYKRESFDMFEAMMNRTPYVQNWNLNIQQSLSNHAVLQIGYVGSKGTKLFRFRDINQPSQAAITAFDLANAASGPVQGYSVPRPYGNFFYVNQEESSAGSVYHSLQGSLRVNGWHGLSTQANFVWSHAIDNASDSEDFIPNASQPQNSLFPQFDRGNSNFDIRRRFTWNFTYELPKRGGNYARLKDGWGFDGVLNLQDGQP